jgi:hypothetical protein
MNRCVKRPAAFAQVTPVSFLRCVSIITMLRTKKPAQLSAKERAPLNRLDRLSEEEIKRLTTRELFGLRQAHR